MSGAGDGIFGDTFGRGKVAAEEIKLLVPQDGYDHTGPVDAGDCRHVRSQLPQNLRAFQQSQVVEGVAEDLHRNGSQGFGETGRRWDPLGGARGKVHYVTSSHAIDRERSTRRMEDDRSASRFETLHDHGGTGQGGVAAKG